MYGSGKRGGKALVGLAFGLFGCGAGEGEGGQSTAQAFRSGFPNASHPAIGLIRTRIDAGVIPCTGVLVLPNVVLTSAVCVQYQKASSLPHKLPPFAPGLPPDQTIRNVLFSIDNLLNCYGPKGDSHSPPGNMKWVYTAQALYSNGSFMTASSLDLGDLAAVARYFEGRVGLIRLTENVPAEVASPMTLRGTVPRGPELDEPVDLYSYGDKGNCDMTTPTNDSLAPFLVKSSNPFTVTWRELIRGKISQLNPCVGDNGMVAIRRRTDEVLGVYQGGYADAFASQQSIWLRAEVVAAFAEQVANFSQGKPVKFPE